MQDEDKIEESSRLLPLNSDLSDEPQFLVDRALLPQTDRFGGRTRRKIRLKRQELGYVGVDATLSILYLRLQART